ncbi:MAG: hypothetical protein KDC87_02050 [Planctomycetes bacterium]|nr:hypothetical protein [Planctomycetota bacterium]
MCNPIRFVTCALATLTLVACATAPNPKAQSLVESIARKNHDIVRLTVHTVPAGSSSCRVVASTLPSKLGKPSDKEDLDAISRGDVVVLDEPNAIDVTVPILLENGKATAAAGVTLKSAMGRDAAVAAARKIAAEIEQGLRLASMKK